MNAAEEPGEKPYGVQLRIVVNEESGELRVPPLVIGGRNGDALFQSHGEVVKLAVRCALVVVAGLVNLDIKEVGSFGYWVPSLIIASAVVVVRAVVRWVIAAELQGRSSNVKREGSKQNLGESHLERIKNVSKECEKESVCWRTIDETDD